MKRLAFIRRAYQPVVERARQMFDVAYEDSQLPADEAVAGIRSLLTSQGIVHVEIVFGGYDPRPRGQREPRVEIRRLQDRSAGKEIPARGSVVNDVDGVRDRGTEERSRKELLFELASGCAENGDLPRALDLGHELANLDFSYKNIGKLLDEWNDRLQSA